MKEPQSSRDGGSAAPSKQTMNDPDEEEPERPEGVPPDAILRVVRVPVEYHGMRLDRFLSHQLRSTSRTRAQAIVDASAYTRDGRRMRASERVKGETEVVLWRPALDEGPPPEEVATLYEDEHLLVVDKPPLMTVHPTARHHRHTVIKLLEERRPGQFLSLIHRLDRETSGVLLLAKTPEAASAFKTALEKRSLRAARRAERGDPVDAQAEKTYVALTWGVPPAGLVTEPLTADPSPLRVKMSIAPSGTGLAARTGIEVIDQADGYALVRCQLHTGRQHQIRVHLAHLGTPIVGDKLYGPDEMLLARGADGELTEEDLVLLELPRHALHAAIYRLPHAVLGGHCTFLSPLPSDLADFWQKKSGRPIPANLLSSAQPDEQPDSGEQPDCSDF